jgi:hypothetical protein
LIVELWGLQGLSWTADGGSLVFSGSLSGGAVMQPMSVSLAGRSEARPVFGVPGRFIVHDVAPDGRWLAVREDLSLGVRARVPGYETERDLSWLGSSGARSLSHDGERLLMVDVGSGGGRDYGVVLRKTDGSETVRLGAGSAQTLSPDGRWASAILTSPPQLVIYPTGPGEAIRIAGGPIERFTSAAWFPDSRRLLVCGSAASRPTRCYAQGLDGAPATPVTPEGTQASVAPDGRLLFALPDGAFELSAVGTGATTRVHGLRDGDRPIGWSRDGRAVFVQHSADAPALVERVDLASGARAVAGRVTPEGAGAISTIYVIDWIDDGRWYVYNYTSLPSTLFVVTGAAGIR